MSFSMGKGSVKYPKNVGMLQVGSIMTSDTVYYDGFEATLVKMTKADIAGAGAIARDTTTAIGGDASLKITTGALANNNTEAQHTFGVNPLGFTGIIRISLWVKMNTATAGDYVEVYYTHRAAGVNKLYRYRIITTAANTAKIQYLNTGGTYSDLTTAFDVKNGYWYYIEFDCDTKTNIYKDIAFANTLHANGAAIDSNADTQYFSTFSVGALTAEAVAKSIYIDEVLIRVV